MEPDNNQKDKKGGDTREQDTGVKFTDVFLTDADQNGKRYIATWVYSVLLLIALFISILSVPALSKAKYLEKPQREIKLQLEGTSSVHVAVGDFGIEYIEISQPKQENTNRTHSTNSNEYLDAIPLNQKCKPIQKKEHTSLPVGGMTGKSQVLPSPAPSSQASSCAAYDNKDSQSKADSARPPATDPNSQWDKSFPEANKYLPNDKASN